MCYKIVPVVQEEKIFKFCKCTFTILLLSPNITSVAFPFVQTQILFIQNCFLPSFGKIGPAVL